MADNLVATSVSNWFHLYRHDRKGSHAMPDPYSTAAKELKPDVTRA